MPKTYFNSLITGNSEMLGCLDENGELVRLFWPDIDYPQHIDRLITGITCPSLWEGSSWLHNGEWTSRQHYAQDTNVAVTVYTHGHWGLKVTQTDFVHPDKPVLTRCYEVENNSSMEIDPGFSLYSSAITTIPQPSGVIYDQGLSAIIHYKHDYYYSVAACDAAVCYQLGGDALGNAGKGKLYGSDTTGMMQDGALLWKNQSLAAGNKMFFTLNICMARDLKTLKILTREISKSDPLENVKNTIEFWHNYLDGAKIISTGDTTIDRLYKRSLLVFALMTNKRTGALLAAPEIDEDFTRCGRYAYCWGRDAAFITTALDKCGLSGAAEGFYRWAARVQDEDGSWQQRYHMDGNLAPSWGLQIDESGSIIWGILKHYESTGDEVFLIDMWPCVKKGVEFLLSVIDETTGIPWLSFDLWEERLGQHAYSTAAACAGIEAGARIGEILGKAWTEKVATESCLQLAGVWRKAALKVQTALEKNFWMPEWNRFVRSVRVKLNAWGEEHTDARVWLKINQQSISRDYTLLDGTVDISLLGLSVPFGIYDSDDHRMLSTAEVVEKVLSVGQPSGLKRYENDTYIGGNPWIIATLWAALYHIDKKSFEKAREYFYWAVDRATEHGLLPEQVYGDTGKPAWVMPLTWSHAMFVLVLDGLIEAGELTTVP